MIHMPQQRYLFLVNGNVQTAGGTKNLAKGQFAIIESGTATANGAKVVSNFAGASPKTKYELRLGNQKLPNTRTSAQNSKPKSSIGFRLSDIVDYYVSAPKTMEQKFDDFIIGYDGINPDTALDFQPTDPGDELQTTVLDIKLSGAAVGILGQPESEYLFKIHFGAEEGQTNQEIVEKAVERAKAQLFPGGVPITDFVDITPVNSLNTSLTGVPYTFYTLTVNDSGDSISLAEVQSQYPNYEVKFSDRSGNVSVYTILAPTGTSLAAFSVPTELSFIKGCEDCPAGYEEYESGFIYAVSLEDDGADLSTTVDNLANAVPTSVTKEGQVMGKGLYKILLTAELSDADKATFIASGAPAATAEITLVGEVVAICFGDGATTIAWVAGETCYATVDTYTLQLKDTECGESRLAELQAAYPQLTIEEGAPTGNATQAVTLTGTSGTANISVAGTPYLATFNTTLTQTATDFVTAHAAAILAATGTVVTANTGVLSFAHTATEFPSISIANASLTLNGTVAAIDYVVTADAGGCQRVYTTQVLTDVVCEECDPIFSDLFISEAPDQYDWVSWVKFAPTYSDAALMGIRITGKPIILDPEEWNRDWVPFYETSARIEVAGGYTEEVNVSWPQYNQYFAVKILSRAEDRDHLGGNLTEKEEESRIFFDNVTPHRKNNFAMAILGEESAIQDLRAQYVGYSITVDDSSHSQGRGTRLDQSITYTMFTPVGLHQPLEDLLNSLCSRAGLEPQQAFPTINQP